MSFIDQVKRDLCQKSETETKYLRAELSGYFATAGSQIVTLRSQKKALKLPVDLPFLSRYLYIQLKTLLGVTPVLNVHPPKQSAQQKRYDLYLLDSDPEQILRILRLEEKSPQLITHDKMPPLFVGDDLSFRIYLKGMFLACGYINDPEKSYHCELSSASVSLMQNIGTHLEARGIKNAVLDRKTSATLYMKDSMMISDFLNLIGAHNSMLKMEDIRILKEMRNDVNRQVNCDIANVTKTLRASEEQIEHIEYLLTYMNPKTLPERVKIVAKARLENPELSLKELGESLTPPLTKSAVYRSLKKVTDMVEKHRILTNKTGSPVHSGNIPNENNSDKM